MQFANINGMVLHYARKKAEGKPHLVFINSLGTDFRIWQGVIDALAGQFDILAYDKRGHGLSSLGEKTPYAIADHADDLIALLAHEGINNAILCGVSVGGMIAMKTFALRPDLVKALVLCDTGHKIGTDEIWNQRIAAVTDKGIPAISSSILERWFSPAYRKPDSAEFAGYRNMLERQMGAGYTATCAGIRDEDLTETARSIDVPTMGLVGEYDGATPPALMEELCALVPGAELHIVKDAGHLPSIEQPEVVTGHILDFTRRL